MASSWDNEVPEETRRELSMWRETFSRLDQDLIQMSKVPGAPIDGSTALTAVHAGPFLSVANAGTGGPVCCGQRARELMNRFCCNA